MKFSKASLKRAALTILAGLAIASLWVALERVTTTDLGPRPANGYHMEPVTYVPPPVPGARVIDVTDFGLAKQPLPFPSTFPTSIYVNSGFSFRGRLKLPADDSIIGVVTVEWFSVGASGKELVNTIEVAVPVKESPGEWVYAIEQKVKLPPGDYFLRILFKDLNSRPPKNYVIMRSDKPVRVAIRPQ